LDIPSGPKLPQPCDVEDIYEVASKLSLEDLRRKSFDFLKTTCSVDNICHRVAGATAGDFPELAKVYEEFVTEHREEILASSAYDQFEEKGKKSERRKLRQILKRLAQK
jgi:hypothetical protein